MTVAVVGVLALWGWEAATYRDEQFMAVVAIVLGQGLPGILFFVLAWWMSKGKFIAYMISIVASVLLIVKFAVGFVMPPCLMKLALSAPCCAPLFMAYVATRAALAWPDIMLLRKVESHDRQYAKQEAMMTSGPLAPPPLMHLPPRPRR